MTSNPSPATAKPSMFAIKGSAGRKPLLLGLCLIAMVLVSGGFVASVLSRSARTPIFTLTGVYGPEWDVNAWVAEDLNWIRELGQSTYSVQALPGAGELAGGFWDQADDSIRAALASCPSERPLVFYVNLHGVVNDDGQACWVPPNGSVVDGSTWFPINDFLDRVAQIQSRDDVRPMLLLLECGRLRSHWPAGIADNDFDDRLTETLAQHARNYPESNVTILSSTARGQRSFYSRRGDGDVFTRYVAEGLAGAADGYGTTNRADGLVDTEELHRFVRQQVGGWSQQHRGVAQTPTLHRTASSNPVTVARASRGRFGASYVKTPPPSKDETDRLKAAIDSVVVLGKHDPSSVDAHAWSQIQRTMHAITQSVYGGEAAKASSARWYSRLDRQLQGLRQEIANRASESSHFADVEMDREAERVWSTIAKQPTRETTAELLDDLDDDKVMPVPMLYAIYQAGEQSRTDPNTSELSFWRHPDWIQRTAKAQTEWLHVVRRLPDAIFPAVDQITLDVQQSRRHLADTILASTLASDVNPIEHGQDGDAHDSVTSALSDFERVVKERRDILAGLVDAWQTRDRAFSELPYLFQSIDEEATALVAHEKHGANEANLNDVITLDTLLNEFIDGKQVWSTETHDQIVIAAKRAGEFLEHMGGSFQTSTASMLLTSDPYHAMRVEKQLRETDEKLAMKPFEPLHQSAGHDHEDDHQHESDKHISDDFLAVLLGLDPDETSPSDVRRRLRSLTSVDHDHAWRHVVSIVVDEAFSQVIADHQRTSRQWRLACRIDEVLGDFWYAPTSNGTAYFDATAQTLLKLAKPEDNETPDWKSIERSVTAKMEARRTASTKGLIVRATSQPSFLDQQTQSVSVKLDTADGQGDLPEGIAVMSIHRDGIKTSDAQQAVSIQATDAPTNVELTLAVDQKRPSLAEVNFRGNRYQSSVMSSGTAFGVTSRGQTVQKGAGITIRDAMDAGRAITFVMDCSASMNDPLGEEMGRSALGAQRASKFEAARSAVYEMMRRLQPGPSQIGLVLYGHRMAIRAGDPAKDSGDGSGQTTLLQKRYHKRFPFPPTIQPFEDVEVALPTGRFDTAELELARQHFDAAVPWGQTPLYLSIWKAMEDISRTGDGVRKDVVVISDGRNYQFNPTPEAIFSIGQLVTRAKTLGVQVHVIGYGLASHEAAAAAIEFEALASGTGGQSITDIKEATELLKRLEELSSSETFELQLADGTKHVGTFGDTITLPEIQSVNTSVTATVGDKSTVLAVSPGDQLDLIANQMEHPLATLPYLNGAPQFSVLATPEGHATTVRMGVHTPTIQENRCRFQLSMQRTDAQVSDRPLSMWVEVHPVRQGNSGQKQSPEVAYRNGAFEWLAGKPCPVAEFDCLGWPSDAVGYQINTWCSAKRLANESVSVAAGSQPKQTKTLANYPGVKVHLSRQGDEVSVGLEYPTSQAPDHDSMLIVHVEGAGSQDHWYDDSGQRSFHVFRQTDPTAEVQIELQSIAEMKRQSVRTIQPVDGSMFPSVATLGATTRR
ncbi:vWA domain-containing protein [Rhodopirellula baltica]|uniref:vWA domain-containing protein n=1 Tax=Rhodopirellula baltica TaxID=265606 RepID=UPI001F3649DF|nr:vWA domain-containing protein [Rhodopirellula baltica]